VAVPGPVVQQRCDHHFERAIGRRAEVAILGGRDELVGRAVEHGAVSLRTSALTRTTSFTV
jgi:hypothetical protein